MYISTLQTIEVEPNKNEIQSFIDNDSPKNNTEQSVIEEQEIEPISENYNNSKYEQNDQTIEQDIDDNQNLIQNSSKISDTIDQQTETETKKSETLQKVIDFIDQYKSKSKTENYTISNDNIEPINQENVSSNQETLWGINLGQPESYYNYPFFSQPETVQLYKDAGIKVIRIFDRRETLLNIEEVVNFFTSNGFTPIIVSGSERLFDYVRKVGTNAIYQIGNEPNIKDITPQEYAKDYENLVSQALNINPEVKFMVAGISIGQHWDDYLKNRPELWLDYITVTIATGAQVDFVDFHHYTLNPGEIDSKDNILERAKNYAEIVQIISEATNKPVCCTEWNFAQWDGPRYDLDESLISEWTRVAMDGMKGCVISCQWYAQNWDNKASPLTMFYSDGTPKPMYFAFKEIAM